MSGFPLILAFVAAIVLMILAISKWKIHPFLSIMGISLVLGLVAGVPLVNRTAADGAVTPGLANVIGSGFSGTFTSIGIVIILGALIGTILEATGAALKLADMVIRVVGKKRPELAVLLSLAAGVWILLAAWDGLRETARLMEELALLAGLDRGVVEPVLKTVILSVVTRLTSEVCRSAGEGGIASFVETAGTVLALVAALPLMRAVAVLMAEMLT